MMLLSPTNLNPENSAGVSNSVNAISNGFQIKSTIKVYKRRFWMMFLYFAFATLGCMLFPQYTTEANVTGCYYGVGQNAVNWTGLISMLVYVVLIIPASLLTNIMDVRRSLILGSALNTFACILQFFTLKPNGFLMVMLSCFLNALSSLFSVGLSPCIAARWFPSHEISRACSFGVLGNHIGVTLGIIFTPLLVDNDCEKKDLIEDGKRNVAYVLTVLNTAVFILICFTFQNTPPFPPSDAEIEKTKDRDVGSFSLRAVLAMMKNRPFLLILLLPGLVAGTFFTFAATANNLMIRFFPKKEVEISGMTTFCSFMGVVGAITAGCFLDYSHKFKETAIVFCAMSFVFYVLFSCLLYLKKLWVQYILAGGYGFFVSGFLPISIEYGVETVFPSSEILSSNLQFASIQAFGLIAVSIISNILYAYGPTFSNAVIAGDLFLCSIIACFLTKNYRRSKAAHNSEEHADRNV